VTFSPVLIACVTLAWLPALAFPLAYLRSAWYSTAPGRSVMALSGVIALAMTLAELRVVGVTPPDWVRSVLYAVIAGSLWYQLGTLLVVQRRRRKAAR
jgi:hypothetical protein